ncbi:MAG: hypothetical protein GY754_21110 [bacterium]|nr:hypothetical protein [bacterium]
MKRITINRYSIPALLCAAALILCFANASLAAPGDKARSLTKSTSLKEKKEKEKNKEKNKKKNWSVGIGAGYFQPLLELGNTMDPSFIAVQVFGQYDLLPWLGIRMDAGFVNLKDKQFDGSMKITSLTANSVFMLPIGMGVEIHPFVGVGVSGIFSEFMGESDSSVDFTMVGGLHVVKKFNSITIGAGCRYIHFLETSNGSGVEPVLFAALRF